MKIKTQHFKSKDEDLLSGIWVDVFLIAIFLLGSVIVDIEHKVSIIEEFKAMLSINPFSAILLLLLLNIPYLIVKQVIYNKRTKKIIANGSAFEGKITDTIYVKALRGAHNYKYTVRLSDGRTVYTEVYYVNFVSENNIRNCTVYEYNDRCYFTDFY